ncbi:MAG: hypothetical protein ACXWVJ_06900, partial [Caulobacteraceae bacterium]
LFLASAGPAAPGPHIATAEVSVAREPMYADIIARARRLKAEADAYRAAPGLADAAQPMPLNDFALFENEVQALSALDMQGHFDLAKRGTDGDLKCILKGISQDLPLKLTEVKTAATGAKQAEALRDISYLLNDNVEVIIAPPKPPV